MSIRRPSYLEYPAVCSLIRQVVTEVYGRLWDTESMPAGNEDWSDGWIAVTTTEIVGVLLTSNDWIDELWVAGGQRGRGIGAELLSLGEAEIAARGFSVSRLRVVKDNVRAVSFYLRHGWQIEKEFPHEHLPVRMLQLQKTRTH